MGLCFSRDKTPGSHGLVFLTLTATVEGVVAAAVVAAGGGETRIMTAAMTAMTDTTSMTIGTGE